MTTTELDTDLLAGRYRLDARIGQGSQGITWRATDTETGQTVAVKKLAMGAVDQWKAVELFEREGEALATLDHPAIPRYVEAFADESEGQLDLYLVQAFVAGTPLDRAIDEGLRLTEDQARDFVRRLLEICAYIHGQDPPVVHRDIKPSNLMRRPDGSLALIDFGAVQTVLPDGGGGSTVVGTTGYMPLEQLMGRAQPATDLYAVGATTIHLLSHVHPAEMEVVEMKLQFREQIGVSPPFEDFLEQLVEPHVEDRFQSAEAALAALDALERSPSATARQPRERPAVPLTHAPEQGGADFGGLVGKAVEGLANSAAQLKEDRLRWTQRFFEGHSYSRPPGSTWEGPERDDERLVLRRPPQGLTGPGARGPLIFVVGWYGFLSIFVVAMVFSDGNETTGSVVGGLAMLGVFALAGLFAVYLAAQKAYGSEEIVLDDQGLTHRTELFGREKMSFVPVESAEAIDFTWTTSSSSKNNRRRTYYYLTIDRGFDEWRFGKELSQDELLWIASVIRDHLTGDDGVVGEEVEDEAPATAQVTERANW